MAIDIIHEIFSGVQVEWERTARVAHPTMTVDETTTGDEILTFNQRDMSDDYYGPAVERLKQRLLQFKTENQ